MKDTSPPPSPRAPRALLPYLVAGGVLVVAVAVAALNRRAAPYVLLCGAGFALALFFVTRSQGRARHKEREALAALRASESRFRTVVEQSPVSMQIFAPDGRTVRVNSAWEELWGVTLEQLGGYNILEDPQLEEKGIAPFIRRAFRGEATHVPAILYDPEETIPGMTRHEDPRRWVQAVIYPVKDEQGNVREVVLMHEDITERRRAEEALRRSEERYRAVIEQASDAILISDLEGRYTEVNPSACRLLGYECEELLGLSITDVLDPEDAPRLEALKARLLDGGTEVSEWRLVRKDRSRVSVEVSTKILPDGRWQAIIRDITERKRLEDELRARAEELSEANRLKDEFLATLSHELRTPLTAILGWAHMLRGRQLDAETQARAIEAVERNAAAQTALINDLLDVSRIITGKLRLDVEPLELGPVIEAAADSLRPAAEARGVTLEVRAGPHVGRVSGDADRLGQVVWNLLSNAVKFTPRGGRVEVSLEARAGHAEVAVSDTGCGIAPEFLPQVFDRFRQADGRITREHGGLGLGLSIARHLIELHGGTISASSPGEGLGATFRFRLPLLQVRNDEGDADDDSATRDPRPAMLSGLRVVVVDDDEDSRAVVSAVLERAGASVSTASSADEALGLIGASRPDVLVADIGMPGVDGYELMRRVRALGPARGGGTPAAALTAYARPEDRALALAAGYQLHLAKPIAPAELLQAVANLAGRQQEGAKG